MVAYSDTSMEWSWTLRELVAMLQSVLEYTRNSAPHSPQAV